MNTCFRYNGFWLGSSTDESSSDNDDCSISLYKCKDGVSSNLSSVDSHDSITTKLAVPAQT